MPRAHKAFEAFTSLSKAHSFVGGPGFILAIGYGGTTIYLACEGPISDISEIAADIIPGRCDQTIPLELKVVKKSEPADDGAKPYVWRDPATIPMRTDLEKAIYEEDWQKQK